MIAVDFQQRGNYLTPTMNITGMPKDKRNNFSGHIDLSSGLFEKDTDLNYTFTYDARNEMSSFEERAY